MKKKNIKEIPGLIYYSNYLSSDEQKSLLKEIYQQKWESSIKRKVQQYIKDYDYSSRYPKGNKKRDPPKLINELKNRLEKERVFTKSIDQIIVNKYEPGEGISAHIDHLAFDDTIVTISLGSSTTMIYTNKEDKTKIPIRLNPGDMVVMTGDSRYKWTHEIPSRKTDRMDGGKPVFKGGKLVPRETRISVTFRRYKNESDGDELVIKEKVNSKSYNSIVYSELLEIFKKLPKETLKVLFKECYVLDFTTKDFCKPYVFDSVEECRNHVYEQTNPVEPHFRQTIFHAATREQVQEYAPNMSKNAKKTFDYLFDKMKKGIYVSIIDNSIEVFLPFSNKNYENDWSDYLKPPKSYKKGSILSARLKRERNPGIRKNIEKILYHLQKSPDIVAYARESDYDRNLKGRKEINDDPSKWYANNCIFRNTIHNYHQSNREQGISGRDDEGDKSVANFLVLLTELCLNRKLPDSEFFISPRDFPVLKKDGSHPYDAIFEPKNDIPIITDNQKSFVPIFSQTSGKNYLDIPIPTDDDIVNFLQVITLPGCNKPAKLDQSDSKYWKWSSRKDMAVFRGSATGCGLTEKNNKRIQLAYLSKATEDFPDGPFLDAALTSMNMRMKKDPLKEHCDYIDPNKYISGFSFNLDDLEEFTIGELKGSRLDDEEQLSFKYVINVEGHSAAFRLSRLFSWRSLVLQVDTPWKLWFEDFKFNGEKLKGIYYKDITKKNYKDIHYIKIKVTNHGTSDVINAKNLINTIKWCRKNDKMAEKIADNGYLFYKKYLNKEGMFDYMQETLIG